MIWSVCVCSHRYLLRTFDPATVATLAALLRPDNMVVFLAHKAYEDGAPDAGQPWLPACTREDRWRTFTSTRRSGTICVDVKRR